MKRKKPRTRIDFENATWELGCWRNRFRQLRQRKGFSTLMALARLINMLRFAQGATLLVLNNDSPFARRQRNGSILLTCALLVEGYRLIPRLGEHFNGTSPFEGLKEFGKDKTARATVLGRYAKIRKKSAFHFDDDIVVETLAGLDNDFVPLVSSHGEHMGFYYCEAADAPALLTLAGASASAAEFETNFKLALVEAADLSTRFLEAADRMLGDTLLKWGCEARLASTQRSHESIPGLAELVRQRARTVEE